MPARPARACTHPGCTTLTRDGTGRCERHPATPWARAKPTQRIRGRKLQEMRERLFRLHPLCVECEAKGRVMVATIRDHRIPLAEGGADDESNEQGLCEACHDVKSKAEAKRGIGRLRMNSPGG